MSKMRIKKLFDLMKLPAPGKKDLKREAKLVKGFMVLLKKKLNRDVLCRSKIFQKLMSLVFHPEGNAEDWD